MRTICAALVAVATLGGCGDDTENAAREQAENRACAELRGIAQDFSDGIIGPADLAERFTDVVRDARGTELHPLAVDTLEAAQRLDDAGIAAPLGQMVDMCGLTE
jgi:hypothetical protein